MNAPIRVATTQASALMPKKHARAHFGHESAFETSLTSIDERVAEVLAWLHAQGFAHPHADLVSDTRELSSCSKPVVFMALTGNTHSAAAIAAQALLAAPWQAATQSGVAVLLSEVALPNCPIAQYVVADLHKMRGALASAFYQYPSHSMQLIAVTGTNGKTSITQWLAQTLAQVHGQCATLGTLGAQLHITQTRAKSSAENLTDQTAAQAHDQPTLTTPDAVALQRQLAQWLAQGVRHVALEASSIGLVQGRLQGCAIDTAVFTNLSRDHLDFHGDMSAYEAAKKSLFDWRGLKNAVINIDDEAGLRLAQVLTKNLAKRADLKCLFTSSQLNSAASDFANHFSTVLSTHQSVRILHAQVNSITAQGMNLQISGGWGQAQLHTPLIGYFNAENLLNMMAVLLAQDMPLPHVCALAQAIHAAPGRMQVIDGGSKNQPLVVVDYAHTPDALHQVLRALKNILDNPKQHHVAQGTQTRRLICVFGCGGNRDAGKRPLMAAAAELADSVIVTSDNPRHENPQTIIDAILQGFSAPFKTEKVSVEADRASAILRAINQAHAQDVVLIAGKGHENYQYIGDKRYPFSDANHARLALHSKQWSGAS